MALLLPHQAVGLVVKMELQHKCTMDTPALDTAEPTLLVNHKQEMQAQKENV